MTILNRALHKAYQRRSDARPDKPVDQQPPAVTGWVAELREPLRPLASPDRSTAPPNAFPTASVALPVRSLPPAPQDSPAAVPAPIAEPSIPAPADGSTGTSVRIDTGHLPAAPNVAPPLQVQTAASAGPFLAEIVVRWSWPPIVRKLLDCPAGAELRKLAASLKHLAATRRLGCLALSGTGRSTGRTSLVLTLARILTETQPCRVAIVDADFGHPQAAELLALHPQKGLWEATCDATAGSVVTPLMPGKLAIVPLVDRVALEAIDRPKIAAIQTLLQSLRREYDLLLVDAGPWESLVPPLVFESRAIDAFLCVSRSDSADERLDDEQYQQPGIEWLGVIETFTPARTKL